MADNADLAHEALHTAYVVSDVFERHVVEHPFVAGDPSLKAMAEQIAEQLGDLYQELGKRTFDND